MPFITIGTDVEDYDSVYNVDFAVESDGNDYTKNKTLDYSVLRFQKFYHRLITKLSKIED